MRTLTGFTLTRCGVALLLIGAVANSQADSVLYDFNGDADGWTSVGPLTTDSGPQDYGVVGEGHSHVADYDLAGWGIVDYSPSVDLSAGTGIRFFARLRQILNYAPFSGDATVEYGLAIGDAKWSKSGTLTFAYQPFSADFSELLPQGTATDPITLAQLSDPNLRIEILVPKGNNTGVAAIDYDQVSLLGPGNQTSAHPGDVLSDFDDNANTCYPDGWGFFGYSQLDFGFDPTAEDGFGAYQLVDWTGCDLAGYPRCDFTGVKWGGGTMHHPHCEEGGIVDLNLDVSEGTGLSVRIFNDIEAGFGGTLGAMVMLQMYDADGTVAVVTRDVVGRPWVHRPQLMMDEWTTYKFFFKALDSSFDNGSSVAGSVPGLDLNHIVRIGFTWRRGEAEGSNNFHFDEITLINDPIVKWGDPTGDGDIDLQDMASMQTCVGQSSDVCPALDANDDMIVDSDDALMWLDCFRGPDVLDGGYPWCY